MESDQTCQVNHGKVDDSAAINNSSCMCNDLGNLKINIFINPSSKGEQSTSSRPKTKTKQPLVKKKRKITRRQSRRLPTNSSTADSTTKSISSHKSRSSISQSILHDEDDCSQDDPLEVQQQDGVNDDNEIENIAVDQQELRCPQLRCERVLPSAAEENVMIKTKPDVNSEIPKIENAETLVLRKRPSTSNSIYEENNEEKKMKICQINEDAIVKIESPKESWLNTMFRSILPFSPSLFAGKAQEAIDNDSHCLFVRKQFYIYKEF